MHGVNMFSQFVVGISTSLLQSKNMARGKVENERLSVTIPELLLGLHAVLDETLAVQATLGREALNRGYAEIESLRTVGE